MSIARKPHRRAGDNGELDAERFIAGAEKRSAATPEAGEKRTTPVMIRFDRRLLKAVDEAARKRGVSRSAWVQYTISRALEAGEG